MKSRRPDIAPRPGFPARMPSRRRDREVDVKKGVRPPSPRRGLSRRRCPRQRRALPFGRTGRQWRKGGPKRYVGGAETRTDAKARAVDATGAESANERSDAWRACRRPSRWRRREKAGAALDTRSALRRVLPAGTAPLKSPLAGDQTWNQVMAAMVSSTMESLV